MSKTKHTPGPWKVGQRIESSGHIGFIRVGIGEVAADIVDCSLCSVHCYGDNAETEANARRIVDCVNACEGIIDPSVVSDMLGMICSLRDELGSTNPDKVKWIALANEVLAKAEGKE